MNTHAFLASYGVLTLNISADTNNYNAYTTAGSPTLPMKVIVRILSGVTVGSTASATPAFVTGAWPAGTVLTIYNEGTIRGQGGNGGAGATGNNPGLQGTAGVAGGSALSLSLNTSLQNFGTIQGGGGGGGGGGSTWWISGTTGGGGGGGGQGHTTSSGGAKGAFTGGFIRDSAAGNPGGAGSAGTGGVGSQDNGGPIATGGTGGTGGTFGVVGNTGGTTSPADGTGGAGGAAGKACALNGFTLTIVVTGTIVGPVS